MKLVSSLRFALGTALVLGALVLASCGGSDGSEEEAPAVPAAVADPLADQADAIAAAVESGDQCTAEAKLEGLNEEIDATAGRIPDDREVQLRAAVDRLAEQIECQPPATEEDKDDEDKDKGKGENGHGNGNGEVKGEGKGKED